MGSAPVAFGWPGPTRPRTLAVSHLSVTVLPKENPMPRKSAATLAAEAEAKAAAEAAAAAAENAAPPADGADVPPVEDAPAVDPTGDVPPHDPPAQGLADALGAPDFVPDPTPSADTDIPAVPEAPREPGDHVGEYVGHGAEFVSLTDGTEWHCDPETGLITAKA